jgi:transposase
VQFLYEEIFKRNELAAVRSYLEGIESLRTTSEKYCVSKSALHRWIARYQNHGENAFQGNYTKYTMEFKMDVLNHISEMGASIEEATALFNVSSTSVVRNWMHLFETQGIDALKPKMKERPPTIKKESKKNQSFEGSEETLRAEIEQLRMENAYLKKLQALIQKKAESQNKTKRK